MADANVIPLQGWLHLQHLVSQVHDGGGGVLVVSLQYAADAQTVVPAVLLQGVVVILDHLDLALQSSDGGITIR